MWYIYLTKETVNAYCVELLSLVLLIASKQLKAHNSDILLIGWFIKNALLYFISREERLTRYPLVSKISNRYMTFFFRFYKSNNFSFIYTLFFWAKYSEYSSKKESIKSGNILYFEDQRFTCRIIYWNSIFQNVTLMPELHPLSDDLTQSKYRNGCASEHI